MFFGKICENYWSRRFSPAMLVNFDMRYKEVTGIIISVYLRTYREKKEKAIWLREREATSDFVWSVLMKCLFTFCWKEVLYTLWVPLCIHCKCCDFGPQNTRKSQKNLKIRKNMFFWLISIRRFPIWKPFLAKIDLFTIFTTLFWLN